MSAVLRQVNNCCFGHIYGYFLQNGEFFKIYLFWKVSIISKPFIIEKKTQCQNDPKVLGYAFKACNHGQNQIGDQTNKRQILKLQNNYLKTCETTE